MSITTGKFPLTKWAKTYDQHTSFFVQNWDITKVEFARKHFPPFESLELGTPFVHADASSYCLGRVEHQGHWAKVKFCVVLVEQVKFPQYWDHFKVTIQKSNFRPLYLVLWSIRMVCLQQKGFLVDSSFEYCRSRFTKY